ncbi:MAG TPA: hypothetical protein VMM13_02285 [Euzebya sp.]|nr:hypothetical protein [Euzebya sp.]
MSSFWPDTPQRHAWHYVAATPLLAAMLWWPFVRGVRVPLLGWIDLAIHEFGHVATIWLPRAVNLAMGSGIQIAVPLLLAAAFWFKSKDPLGAGLGLAWAGTSAQDASVYIADAPVQRLQLIGGVHDWGTLLGPQHLDALSAADDLARLTWTAGFLMTLGGCAIVARWGWLAFSQDAAPAGPLPDSWSLPAGFDPLPSPSPGDTTTAGWTALTPPAQLPPGWPSGLAAAPSRTGDPAAWPVATPPLHPPTGDPAAWPPMTPERPRPPPPGVR